MHDKEGMEPFIESLLKDNKNMLLECSNSVTLIKCILELAKEIEGLEKAVDDHEIRITKLEVDLTGLELDMEAKR